MALFEVDELEEDSITEPDQNAYIIIQFLCFLLE